MIVYYMFSDDCVIYWYVLQGLVGAVFEGIGVSMGSLIGGILMQNIGGSGTFRLFSVAAFFCFISHVFIQWLLTRISGPYGKKSSVHISQADSKSIETLEINAIENNQDKMDELGFKDIDLSGK